MLRPLAISTLTFLTPAIATAADRSWNTQDLGPGRDAAVVMSDNGHAVAVWVSGTKILASRRLPGRTFAPPEVLHTGPVKTARPFVAIGKTGVVAVTWRSAGKAWLATAKPKEKWSRAVRLGDSVPSRGPQAAVSDSGRVFVVFEPTGTIVAREFTTGVRPRPVGGSTYLPNPPQAPAQGGLSLVTNGEAFVVSWVSEALAPPGRASLFVRQFAPLDASPLFSRIDILASPFDYVQPTPVFSSNRLSIAYAGGSTAYLTAYDGSTWSASRPVSALRSSRPVGFSASQANGGVSFAVAPGDGCGVAASDVPLDGSSPITGQLIYDEPKPASGNCTASQPQLATRPDGSGVLVFRGGPPTVSLSLRPAGSRWLPPFQISGQGKAAAPDVAVGTAGDAVVSWNESGQVRAALYARATPSSKAP